MYKDDKKYHMDLKENARGRFLKVSETFTRGYSRFQVINLYSRVLQVSGNKPLHEDTPGFRK